MKLSLPEIALHNNSVNSFNGGGGLVALPTGTPFINVKSSDNRIDIVIGDFNRPSGKTFKAMSVNLKTGLKELRNAVNTEGWLVVFPSINNKIALGQNETDSLYIESVEAVKL